MEVSIPPAAPKKENSMRLGFYGDSTACWTLRPINKFKPFIEEDKGSFIDTICKKYKAICVSTGAAEGSIERILVNLKKTKKIDFAFIFYSSPSRFYLPNTDRDIDIGDFDKYFSDKKANYLFNIQKQNTENLKKDFDNLEEFIKTISLYKKYLYDPDVHLNRWYGALIQIDQYITAKNIPCVHVVNKNIIPPWFEFSSGIVAHEIYDLCKQNYDRSLPNNISEQGQDLIADALIKIVDKFTNNSSRL